jgi:UDPglucose--hexose-1-phosphate uridylyltransferase
MRALAARFDGPPELNLWVRTAPRGAEHFGWHVDIAPRLTIKAGFELGTGVDINVYPPEKAAADLREALGD